MVDRDALIGVVASGYATLSCGQFQDNTYMECLVGEEDGSLSHYLDVLDGDDAEEISDRRFVQDETFSYDTGKFNAVPFCMEFEAENYWSCLYGTSNGKVYHLANSGAIDEFDSSDMSNEGAVIRTSKRFAAPFCGDFDGDNDIDCIVGYDDGLLNTGVQFWENSCNKQYCPVASDNFTKTRDSFFGTAFNVSIRYPKPFCIDMDEDEDLDCLIGDIDGKVHYLRNDGNLTTPLWTYVTGDYFTYDVGSHAAPFCALIKDFYVGGTSAVEEVAPFNTDQEKDHVCLVGNAEGSVFRFHKINKAAFQPTIRP